MENRSQEIKKVCLVVIDGWGISPCEPLSCADSNVLPLHPNLITYDAIKNAQPPYMSNLMYKTPLSSEFLSSSEWSSLPQEALSSASFVQVSAHGLAVGLPPGLMGNSEVGHLNIGAGRVVYQDIVRINKCASEKAWSQQPYMNDFLNATLRNPSFQGKVHLIGLVSDGGVHSHISHLFSLLSLFKEESPKSSPYVHFIADGRDTSPQSSMTYVKQLYEFFMKENYGHLGTVVGRYYAMDRDSRWERIDTAYRAYTGCQSTSAPINTGAPLDYASQQACVLSQIETSYQNQVYDEFLQPIVVDSNSVIGDGDAVVFFNYRSDRMRQLVSVFINNAPSMYPNPKPLKDLHLISMTSYNAAFSFPVIFPQQNMSHVLSEWISLHGLGQSHIAETEKYAHVTFFFNGGLEKAFPGEDRVLIPSPKVSTYNLQPKMSCLEVSDAVCQNISSSKYSFVICNLAPPDMVGHTGYYEETLAAVQATDVAIGRIYTACCQNNFILFVTSDHGNAEKMVDEQGRPHTAHTTAPVPFIMANNKDYELIQSSDSALCNIAPTVLQAMGLDIPPEMTARGLLVKKQQSTQ